MARIRRPRRLIHPTPNITPFETELPSRSLNDTFFFYESLNTTRRKRLEEIEVRPFNRYTRTMSGLIITAAIAALVSGCNLTSSSSDDDDNGDSNALVAQIAQGEVQGIDEGPQIAFRGIPFAEPPVGDLRLAPPEPHDGWDGTLQADEYGAACIQTDGVFAADTTDEDCLYLNVFTPQVDDGDRPVMVWIYGGAFETGSTSDDYNPPRLVDEDVVVVTINYRLGLLGFTAHPDLTAEGNGTSGNYGMLDQVAALEWVQDNIANFGGDPDNVTIFGESAGGHSVLALLASPETEDLFHRVIVQSGSYGGDQPTLAEAEDLGVGRADALGCDEGGVDCLRDLDASAFADLQAAEDMSFVPTSDTHFLPETTNTVIGSGDHAPVEVLAGTNLDEGTLFTAIELFSREPTADEDYEEAVAGIVGPELAGSVVEEYPLADYDSADQALSAIATSIQFVCPALSHHGQFAENGTMVYAYEFADRDAPPLFSSEFEMGASHAFEIQYLFSDEDTLAEERGMTEDQLGLANAMVRYWANFARHGDPNPETGDLPHWPTFMQGELMELDTPEPDTLAASEFSAYHKCGFWAEAM